MVTRNGACPDTQNDVHSVSGYRDGCKTCIKYSRSLQSGRIIDIGVLVAANVMGIFFLQLTRMIKHLNLVRING